jgi:hypothetical protein
MENICSIKECNSLVRALTFCSKHYTQYYRRGLPEDVSKHKPQTLPEEVLLTPQERFVKRRPNRFKEIRQKYNSSEKGKLKRSEYYFKNQYNLTLDEYERRVKEQNNLCAICKKEESTVSKGRVIKLSLDHDHQCCLGKKSCGRCIRSLLCFRCNSILGKAKEDISLLENLIGYLKKWNEKNIR